MKGKFEWSVAIAIAVLFALIALEWKTCADAGGAFVRGIVWFECVAR